VTAPVAIRFEPSRADPDVARFAADRPVAAAPASFGDAAAARAAPLAAALFALPGVRRVSLDGPVATVAKARDAAWDALKPQVAAAIRRTLAQRGPQGAPPADAPAPGGRDDAALFAAIGAAIEAEVNPSVARHGGRIELVAVRDGEALLRMSGGCQGCAASALTLRGGVERMVRAVAPEIRRVVDVTDHAAGTAPWFAGDGAGAAPLPEGALSREGGGWTVRAEHLAPGLGVDPETLRAEMRAGRVTSVEERGEGADAGLTRLTVRWGARLWRAIVGPDGRARAAAAPAAPATDEDAALAARARRWLDGLDPDAAPVTYAALAAALDLRPPHAIGRAAAALEATMREDAAAGRPFLAALVVGRARGGVPAPGFFDTAAALGRGPRSGEDDRAFHAREMAAALAVRTASD
jgi:Fe-S cluster biogenesis protein NfuA